jgi:hypothetical protein
MSKARDLANAADVLDDVSATELGYLDGVTSAIQTQLDAKTAKSTLTTTGDIYYASAANTPARLGIGTASQILAVNSGATAPEWVAAPASGSMTLLSTTSLTGASVTVSSIVSGYRDLRVFIEQYRPATDASALQVRLNSDATTLYNYGAYSNSTITRNVEEMRASALNTDDGASNSQIIMTFQEYTNTNVWKIANILGFTNNSTTATNAEGRMGYGIWFNTAAITSLTFFPNTGNFTSGTVYIYGVK